MPRLIINLRGTSGSGKTTIVKKLLATAPNVQITDEQGKRLGVKVLSNLHWRQPLFAIGKYDTVCGGMDTIPTQADCATAVANAYGHGHVVCEGLLASGVGPKATLPACCIALAGPHAWFLCLDTPLDVCLERVRLRREARGNLEPMDPKNTESKWKQTRDSYKALEDVGASVRWLPYETAYEKVVRMLEIADAAG